MKFGVDADAPRGGGSGGGFDDRGFRGGDRGEDRPYHPRQRPSFVPQGRPVSGPPMRGPRHDDSSTGSGPGDRSAHPLAMQFRREREEKFRRERVVRGPRPFKKTHY